ncbi:hypothetical protein TgHK011_000472 [Trichoderma gracile]|nr:hypothetical protein TgHK011_000472 [Trichoderma gracile]
MLRPTQTPFCIAQTTSISAILRPSPAAAGASLPPWCSVPCRTINPSSARPGYPIEYQDRIFPDPSWSWPSYGRQPQSPNLLDAQRRFGGNTDARPAKSSLVAVPLATPHTAADPSSGSAAQLWQLLDSDGEQGAWAARRLCWHMPIGRASQAFGSCASLMARSDDARQPGPSAFHASVMGHHHLSISPWALTPSRTPHDSMTKACTKYANKYCTSSTPSFLDKSASKVPVCRAAATTPEWTTKHVWQGGLGRSISTSSARW